LIQHDVKANQFIADTAIKILGLRKSVLSNQMGLAGAECFDNEVFDFLSDFSGVFAFVF